MTPNNVLVAGSAGMVGSAICRALTRASIPFFGAQRTSCDFSKIGEVDKLFDEHDFDAVIIAAAKVGGIHANNTYPAEFLYENLMIQTHLIDAAYRRGINKLIFLGSSCIYPKEAAQPMIEEALLSGALEPTNEPYAIAKIAGIKLCESYNRQYGTDYRSLMPTNLYGPGDNFHPENSHVIPALMERFHKAKLDNMEAVDVWGSGNPRREFLHVDDLAAAVVHVLCLDRSVYETVVDERCSHLNVGTGHDVTIRELAQTICEVVGLSARLEFDSSKPDGTSRKLLNINRIKKLGWQPSYNLKQGLQNAYEWYLSKGADARR